MQSFNGPYYNLLKMADCCPYGMIFVFFKKGIIHHPDEYATMQGMEQ